MSHATMAEKILSQKCGHDVRAGDFCVATVDLAMVQEMLFYMIPQFEDIGIPAVWDRDRIVVFLDHYAPASNIESA